jgi:hypothetical protein
LATARAMAWPIPPLAPVTRTLPVSSVTGGQSNRNAWEKPAAPSRPAGARASAHPHRGATRWA